MKGCLCLEVFRQTCIEKSNASSSLETDVCNQCCSALRIFYDLFSDRQKSHAQSWDGTEGSKWGENTLSAKASIYNWGKNSVLVERTVYVTCCVVYKMYFIFFRLFYVLAL